MRTRLLLTTLRSVLAELLVRNHVKGQAALLLTVLGAAACGGSKSPASPSGASSTTPTIAAVTVTGEKTSVQLGENVQLSAVARFSDGSTRNVSSDAQWSSSDPGIASVTNGTVTTITTGEVEVSAIFQGATGRLKLTVTSANRHLSDQPDEMSGHQVKILYVVPSDRPDEELDTNGTLAVSVSAFQNWLARESGGRRIRVDTYRGLPDIAFVRLPLSDGQITSAGAFQRDRLERELNDLGFRNLGKMYAVYYGGGHRSSCGDGFLPPALEGNVVAQYLYGTPPGARPCGSNEFATSEQMLGYREFLMLHEIFHGMGVVPDCAPHERNGHVDDDSTDLMYAGALPWSPSRLDVNRDDYFQHGSSCLDAAASPFLD